MTIHCRVIALLYAYPSRDIVTLIFDLFHVEQMSYIASHVTNLATKYEDPTPIHARSRFAYSLCNFGGSTMKVIKIMHGPVLKDYEFLRMREIT